MTVMGKTNAIYAQGSFAEVIQRNVFWGQAGKWIFMVEAGRIWNVIGLFLVGFVLGRLRFFENYRKQLHICAAALAAGVLLLGVIHTAQAVVSSASLPDASAGMVSGILNHYSNNLITITGVILFLLAYELKALQIPMNWLAPCGRMSLTIYVSQSLYGVPLFYGFGLGLYQGLGQVNALALGLGLWGVQMLISYFWMKHYYYGPLEWLWRAATYLNTEVPWKRIESHPAS